MQQGCIGLAWGCISSSVRILEFLEEGSLAQKPHYVLGWIFLNRRMLACPQTHSYGEPANLDHAETRHDLLQPGGRHQGPPVRVAYSYRGRVANTWDKLPDPLRRYRKYTAVKWAGQATWESELVAITFPCDLPSMTISLL